MYLFVLFYVFCLFGEASTRVPFNPTKRIPGCIGPGLSLLGQNPVAHSDGDKKYYMAL